MRTSEKIRSNGTVTEKSAALPPSVPLSLRDLNYMISLYKTYRTNYRDKTLSSFFHMDELIPLIEANQDAMGVRIYYALHYKNAPYTDLLDHTTSYLGAEGNYEDMHTLIICPVDQNGREKHADALVGRHLSDLPIGTGPKGDTLTAQVPLTARDLQLMIALYRNHRTTLKDDTISCFYPMDEFSDFIMNVSDGKGLRVYYGLHYFRAPNTVILDHWTSFEEMDNYDDRHTAILCMVDEDGVEDAEGAVMKVVGAPKDGGSLCPPKGGYVPPGALKPELMRLAEINFPTV